MALARISRARPTICSQPIGLRLCGMADEPFCPLPNGSSTSPISVFCRPRISSANFSSDAAVIASARQQLRVPIALNHLRRNRRRHRGRAAGRLGFDRRIEMREGADGAGDLADAHRLAGAAHAFDVAPQLRVPQRQLEAERHRLGVDAVRAPDHRRLLVLVGARLDRLGERRRGSAGSGRTPRPSAAPAPCRRRRTRSGRSAASGPTARHARRPRS